MINPLEQYRAMRNSGLTRLGSVCFVALMVVTSPFAAIATWATPHETGFGKFRSRERIVDIADLEESTHVIDRTDRRFFIQPTDTQADSWWHEEIRMLRMLEAKTMLDEAVARLQHEADERNKTRLVTVVVVGTLAAFAVAMYAMRYLK